MTKDTRDKISERLRAARASVAPILGGRRYYVAPHQTSTLCKDCFAKVYLFPGDLLVNEDGTAHECGAVPHDTDPPAER